ncbi:hypothetical protein SprV_0301326500 [Sparganum proliferum]
MQHCPQCCWSWCSEGGEGCVLLSILTIAVERTVARFLQNQWAAQLGLNNTLMDRQKVWEENFWNSCVKKGGDRFERGSFNEGYWRAKAADMYPLMKPDGEKPAFAEGQRTYSEQDIEAWLQSFPAAPAAQDAARE